MAKKKRKTAGRPKMPPEDQRSVGLRSMIRPEEAEAVRLAAAKARMSISDWVRDLIRRELGIR